MKADDTGHDRPKQAAYPARWADTWPALTPRGGVGRVRRRRVLVLHGDEEIGRLIAVSLMLEGFDVTTAADSRDCLRQARAAMPDVLVTTSLNPHEPGERGRARRLLRYLAKSRIKVLLISPAHEPGEDPGVSTRIDACLTMPFDPAEMIRTVRNLAGASDAQRRPLAISESMIE